jgi:hypothetical protein
MIEKTHSKLIEYGTTLNREQRQELIDELLILFNVSKCLHPYKKVISGDDGMWCTECNKYITTF